ncbi:UNVERIFIED_CONTAM: hypothetical protein GTU68_005439 [Idotea baltica]|nr:hypothetical protein [Idotea baltica]
MVHNFFLITQGGLLVLKKELLYRKRTLRLQILKDIRESLEHGDLKENSEYKIAKENQLLNEKTILSLQLRIYRSRIISNKLATFNSLAVVFNSRVLLFSYKINQKITYHIIGTDEININKNKISVLSPLGQAILHKKKRFLVDVSTPSGILKYRILRISCGQ